MLRLDPIACPVHFGPDLGGELSVPSRCEGLIVFAQASGSRERRTEQLALALHIEGFATLTLDLLTASEQARAGAHLDVGRLTARLRALTVELSTHRLVHDLPVGLFGTAVGAAAAIRVATELEDRVQAVVCRGGHPDLAGDALERLRAPTLLIVGSRDRLCHRSNMAASRRLNVPRHVAVVRRASHRFVEPGALQEVAALANDWFSAYLAPLPCAS